jgi:hypothetical protein
LPATGGHPFDRRLNQVLKTRAFDVFVEALCESFCAANWCAPDVLSASASRGPGLVVCLAAPARTCGSRLIAPSTPHAWLH